MRFLILLLLTSVSAFADYYVIRDKTTKEVIARSTRDDGYIPEALDAQNAEVVWVIDELPPPYDPATEKLISTVTETGSNPIIQTHGYDVVPLSAEELDAIAAAEERQAATAQLRTDHTLLTTWANETIVRVTSANVNAIAEQNQTRIKEISRILADMIVASGAK